MGGKIHIFINQNHTECMIRLDTAFCDVFEEDVLKLLADNGIVFGLVKENLDKFINGNYDRRNKVLIAKGKAPQVGKDGYFELLISEIVKIKEDKFGKADFYDIGLIKTVQKGDRLVKIYPPFVGEEGSNLLGEKMPGLLGKPADINRVRGEGVEIDDTGSYLIASKSGCYKKKYGMVTVLDELRIESDINFSVGNIDTTATVAITGDIKFGFVCKTTADLVINGIIEDSTVDVRDNIICKYGITAGNNPVKAGKSIRVKYIIMRNNIFADNIHVETSVVESQLNAISLIQAKKITGGRSRVRHQLVVDELGNENFSKTLVEIGITQEDILQMALYYAEMKKQEKELKETSTEISTRDYLLKEFIEEKGLILLNTKNPILIEKYESEKAKKELALEKVNDEYKRLNSIYENLKKRYEELKEFKEKPTSSVMVKGTVYPNVVIMLNTFLKYEVRTKMSKVVFKLNDKGELKPFELKDKGGEGKEML